MDAPTVSPADEAARLRRCLNDLVSIVALPALWTGGEQPRIIDTLLDALAGMLDAAFVFARLNDAEDGPSIDVGRVADAWEGSFRAGEIGKALDASLGSDCRAWPTGVRITIGGTHLSVASVCLGLQGHIGAVAVASERNDFPGETERLILDVAANQAALRLQQARLLSEQRRVAAELDEHVAQRTTDLRRSEAFLAEAQQLSQVGSFSWRVATDEVKWSEHLYRIFEIDLGLRVTLEMIGARVHPEDLPAFQEQTERSRREGSDVQLEVRLQMPDGTIKYVHVVAHCRGDRGQYEYIGAVQDVTRSRLSEAALAKVRSELAAVARVTSLGALTASIAHEVNQPLAGIVTNASTCLRMLGADPPDIDGARETARRTIRDGHRASDVITRLRALFSKKELTRETLDLNEAAREVVALMWSDFHRQRVVLQAELADHLPIITGDRIQLQQVILNLLRNASEAMVDVHERPRLLLIKTQRDDDNGVRLTVRDAGVGLPPQGLDSLFDAFYTTKSGGMGIGLFVSRSILERHQGRLWAEPNDGPGATFSFSIPFQTT